ncbi:MAG: ImmA/IrrE family metallo-endopeptidase [Acutalibacteraceae bacterium]|jgi:hypothetical protein
MNGTKKRITAEGLEAKAEMMLKEYLGGNFGMLQAVDMERMATEYFGLSVRYEPLSLQSVSVWKQTCLRFADDSVRLIPAGTILVDSSLRGEKQRGRRNLTIARECARQLLFWKEPNAEARAAQMLPAQSMVTPRQLRASCVVNEWEVNALASALLMPPTVLNTILSLFYADAPVCVYGRGRLSAADSRMLDTLAALLGVTRSALLLRLWQLHKIAVLPDHRICDAKGEKQGRRAV